MQKAEQILQALRKMGEKRTPLTRVYRSLFSEDLFLAAYAKIARNRGALTPGTENDTADGMSLTRVRNIIEQLRQERFRFHPARRIQVPKKSGGKRPLGIPNFTDKLVQEALRMVLEAYFEPRFRDSSHGFRPGRGCHTALANLNCRFRGSAWFIEGDIRGCFDNIDHQVLMDIISRDIQDGRLLNLIQMGLEAGYMEDWQYHKTYSGTPQGGILSPLLANIYLNELDTFIEEELIPQYTKGLRRACSPEYERITNDLRDARVEKDEARVKELIRKRRQTPSQNVQDPNFRRLRYIRYADDFILGFIGPKTEAEAIKTALSVFLKEKLHLEMSETKTLITHARTEHARFLGYEISIHQADTKLSGRSGTYTKTRSANGRVRLGVPYGKVDELGKRYLRNGKPTHEAALLAYSDAQIIEIYQLRYRGVAEFYKYAVDRSYLSKLRNVMETALTKTLAHKYKLSVPKIYQKYRGKQTVKGYAYKVLQVEVPTKNGSRCIYWGAVPLRVVKPGTEPITDEIGMGYGMTSQRTDLIRRLQANECELCGSHEKCEVHHIRSLSDLKKRWQGQKVRPDWMIRMIAMQRKTLIVCQKCHVEIHAGRLSPK
jgi:group II intron reverse transcriptase/maturase